jgi:hypothetical protein
VAERTTTSMAVRPELDLTDARWQSGTQEMGGVEIAFVEGWIAMRNGRTPEVPAVIFSPGEWNAFVLGARNGRFDLT